MFCCCLLEACSSLTGDRKGGILDGRGSREELGGVTGGGFVIKIYCVCYIYAYMYNIRKSIFNKKQIKKRNNIFKVFIL